MHPTVGIDLVLFLLLAIIGGLLGALFNQLVEHLNHLRVHHVNHSAVLRFLEVLALVLITVGAELPRTSPSFCSSGCPSVLIAR